MTDLTDTIKAIRSLHRRRRFAMKIQQKLDRALESFVRITMTNWSPDLPEAERKKINAQVLTMIAKIRDGGESEYADVVAASDRARAPADEMRDVAEGKMEAAARLLPVYPWVEAIRGAGALGLATIVAECGHLSAYSNPSKVWKRLGYAPYDGFAGSTWKRDSWRPRALTAEEWIENPFSGAKYALTSQVITWLVNAQTKSKTKTESGETEATGPYGEIYCARRAKCLETHPDWSDGHRRSDALRVTMKEFLRELFAEWQRLTPYDAALDNSLIRDTAANNILKPNGEMRPSRNRAKTGVKPKVPLPGSPTKRRGHKNPPATVPEHAL